MVKCALAKLQKPKSKPNLTPRSRIPPSPPMHSAKRGDSGVGVKGRGPQKLAYIEWYGIMGTVMGAQGC
jgi:hypothetical protein